jgi:adenylate cyclase class 2
MNQRNVEFKAELRDPEAARAQCKVLGGQFIGVMQQTDVYYRMPEGRLKRRTCPGEPTEWIEYRRPDRAAASTSNYAIYSDDQAQRRWGSMSLREWVTVRKSRELWMIDDVRVHLDDVETLGRFLEFEAIIGRIYDEREAYMAVAELRDMFKLVLGESISASYCDLIAAGGAPPS